MCLAHLKFVESSQLKFILVQQLTGKFCKNCSLCDKSTKFSMAIDLSATNDFKMGATSKLFV